jgi:hypothetical protein
LLIFFVPDGRPVHAANDHRRDIRSAFIPHAIEDGEVIRTATKKGPPMTDDLKSLPPINLGYGRGTILSNLKTAPARTLTEEEVQASLQKQRDYLNEEDPVR